MTDDIDGPRLARFISGQCTADEVADMRRWMAENPDNARLVAELEAAWQAAGLATYEWGVDEGWRSFRDAKEAQNREGRNRPALRLVPIGDAPDHGFPVRRIAAAIVLVAGSCLTWWGVAHRRPLTPTVEQMTEVATQRGQRATLRLADGTRVSLGMASRLRYARTFGDAARDVYLDGDGYFEVVHDTAHPFVVHTAHAVVRDIGTKFAVRAYATAPATEVVVTEGIVAMAGAHATEPPLVLHALDLGRIEQDGRTVTVVHAVDTADYLGWTDGRLVFHDMPLREVIAELGRWYDLDLRIAPGDSVIGARRLTASFENESLPLVIERIALSLDLKAEHHGQTTILRPRHH